LRQPQTIDTVDAQALISADVAFAELAEITYVRPDNAGLTKLLG
jgi:hypothetical protein